MVIRLTLYLGPSAPIPSAPSGGSGTIAVPQQQAQAVQPADEFIHLNGFGSRKLSSCRTASGAGEAHGLKTARNKSWFTTVLTVGRG